MGFKQMIVKLLAKRYIYCGAASPSTSFAQNIRIETTFN